MRIYQWTSEIGMEFNLSFLLATSVPDLVTKLANVIRQQFLLQAYKYSITRRNSKHACMYACT